MCVGPTLDDVFSPQLFYRHSTEHFQTGSSCFRRMSDLIKSREYNVQNVTVILRPMRVFTDVMIKPVFPNRNVFETLDGMDECAADSTFVLMFVMS